MPVSKMFSYIYILQIIVITLLEILLKLLAPRLALNNLLYLKKIYLCNNIIIKRTINNNSYY